MNISDADNENWYRDASNFKNIKEDNFKKVYYN